MARPSKTEQEIGYIRSFWDEVRELEANERGSFVMYVSPTQRPGVFAFRMVFQPLYGTEEAPIYTEALEFIYPNAERSTLAGFLWRKAIGLTVQVLQGVEARGARPRKRG